MRDVCAAGLAGHREGFIDSRLIVNLVRLPVFELREIVEVGVIDPMLPTRRGTVPCGDSPWTGPGGNLVVRSRTRTSSSWREVLAH